MRILLLSALLALPLAARAAEPVDLALVLLADTSTSIDQSEFELQKAGYAQAFAEPAVVDRILGGPTGAAAIAYVEFAGRGEASTVIDWTVVRSAEEVLALGRLIALAPRSYSGDTSISTGIRHATQLLASAPVEAARQVIDVSADGRDPSDGAITKARDAALAAGITVNGLAIIDDRPIGTIDGRLTYTTWEPSGPLTDYFDRFVIGGPGSFVVEARDFSQFGEALTRKLIVEISGTLPPPRRLPAEHAEG